MSDAVIATRCPFTGVEGHDPAVCEECADRRPSSAPTATVRVVCNSPLHGSVNQFGRPTPCPCFVCGAPLPGPAGHYESALATGELERLIRERIAAIPTASVTGRREWLFFDEASDGAYVTREELLAALTGEGANNG